MEYSERDVLAAAARLVAAFGSHDVDGYFAGFTEDASFIFHNLDRILKSRSEYQAEWRLWESRDGFRVLGCRSSDRAVQLSGNVAVFTHTVETDLSIGGERITNQERETIVFRHDAGAGWIAFHEHLSTIPI
jgi:ketosteroid isomerase-like protein